MTFDTTILLAGQATPPLMQLVLFPDVVGVDVLSLDECARLSAPKSLAEEEEPPRNVFPTQMPEQLSLFPQL
ncbi:hypothetical protein KDA_74600 [Dictyobacter alpinus]|uniref:Uncharacterized protein n=1 Tax=Dictyobacter alpinus TaxID=2014873 RepID=A0A402BKX3_9CHLR|nr:hypothetical protein [Dictyobacter alpinus]GCE31976.1 hypothetical protein KDA_74600 [Dictyobacter alpinus]